MVIWREKIFFNRIYRCEVYLVVVLSCGLGCLEAGCWSLEKKGYVLVFVIVPGWFPEFWMDARMADWISCSCCWASTSTGSSSCGCVLKTARRSSSLSSSMWERSPGLCSSVDWDWDAVGEENPITKDKFIRNGVVFNYICLTRNLIIKPFPTVYKKKADWVPVATSARSTIIRLLTFTLTTVDFGFLQSGQWLKSALEMQLRQKAWLQSTNTHW